MSALSSRWCAPDSRDPAPDRPSASSTFASAHSPVAPVWFDCVHPLAEPALDAQPHASTGGAARRAQRPGRRRVVPANSSYRVFIVLGDGAKVARLSGPPCRLARRPSTRRAPEPGKPRRPLRPVHQPSGDPDRDPHRRCPGTVMPAADGYGRGGGQERTVRPGSQGCRGTPLPFPLSHEPRMTAACRGDSRSG